MRALARYCGVGALLAVPMLPAAAQRLALPERPDEALTGSAFAAEVRHLPLDARELRVREELERGNIPGWLRALVPVAMVRQHRGVEVRITFWAMPDYLAIGSDDDYLLIPIRPQLAQWLADRTGTSLPTPVMVNAIWVAAPVKLGPDSIAPSAAMITMPVFEEHDRMVRERRRADPHPMGTLIAGHKKDVVLTPRLDTLANRVAIYGWHKPDGTPIQPLNTWHTTSHVDYSHGIRLVARPMLVDGLERDLLELLLDSMLVGLVSDEGTMRTARYPDLLPPSVHPDQD
jgi:hypothetical protein